MKAVYIMIRNYINDSKSWDIQYCLVLPLFFLMFYMFFFIKSSKLSLSEAVL